MWLGVSALESAWLVISLTKVEGTFERSLQGDGQWPEMADYCLMWTAETNPVRTRLFENRR